VTRLTVTGFGAFFLDTRHVDGNRPLLHLFALSRSKSVPTRDSHVAQNPSPLFAELGEGEGHAANSDVENQHNEQLIDFFGRHLSYHEPASARG